MVLTQKETEALKDLQTQEQSCIEKYTRYSQEAKDPQLKDLFKELSSEEQKHYQSLGQALNGQVPKVDCNDTKDEITSQRHTTQRMTILPKKERTNFS